MKESNNHNFDQEIKNLKIKQQASRIVSRKDIELAAVIQATKDNMKNPQKSIEVRKEEIVKQKLKEQAKKDRQALKEAKLVNNMEKNLSKWTDIDEVLSLLDDEEEKRVQKRSEDVQKIMNELNAKKNSKGSKTQKTFTPSKAPVSSRQANLEKKELDNHRTASRKEQNEKEALATEFNVVLQKAAQKRLNEKIEKATEEIRKKNVQPHSNITPSTDKPSTKSKAQTAPTKKTSLFSSFSKFFSKSAKKQDEKNQDEIPDSVVVKNVTTKQSTVDNKKTISSYKVTPGVKVYQESMDYYNTGKIRHLIDITIGIIPKGIKNARQTFVDSLRYMADPEAARKSLENNNTQQKTTFREHYT